MTIQGLEKRTNNDNDTVQQVVKNLNIKNSKNQDSNFFLPFRYKKKNIPKNHHHHYHHLLFSINQCVFNFELTIRYYLHSLTNQVNAR